MLQNEEVERVLNFLKEGELFESKALTAYPTSRNSVVFNTAKPDRPQWLKEMDPIPVNGLKDDDDIVATSNWTA